MLFLELSRRLAPTCVCSHACWLLQTKLLSSSVCLLPLSIAHQVDLQPTALGVVSRAWSRPVRPLVHICACLCMHACSCAQSQSWMPGQRPRKQPAMAGMAPCSGVISPMQTWLCTTHIEQTNPNQLSSDDPVWSFQECKRRGKRGGKTRG